MIDASLFIDPVLGIFYWLFHVVVNLAHAWSYMIYHIKCLIIYSEFLPKYKNLKLDRLQHLAVVIDSEEATNKTNIDLLLFWLAALKVNYITLYDIEGVLKKSDIGLPKSVVIDSNTKCSDVDVNTPSIFMKFGMTVEVISYTDGKEAAAKAANYLSSKKLRNQEETLSLSELKFTEDDILRALKAVGHDGPEPDLMLIYGPVRCHFGFPAWRLRYTEIVHMGPLSSLKYSGIVKAFYDFSKKHQNYGK